MSNYINQIPDPVRTVTTTEYREEWKWENDENGTPQYKRVKVPFQVTRKMRFVVVKWHEVKDQVRAVIERGEPWTTQPSGASLRALYEKPDVRPVWRYVSKKKRVHYWDDYRQRRRWRYEHEAVPVDWVSSGNEIKDWLANGFRSPEFENLADRVPSAMQHRPYWNEEEGDVEVNRLVSGWDDFYFGLQKRPTKPAIRVQIEMAFAYGVAQKTIEQYGAWINSLLGSMEAYGIDMSVDIWVPVDKVFRGDDDSTRSNVLVRVKNSNEVSDFTDWSILFSPAGFRQILLAADCLAGDKIGKRVNNNYGNTIGGKSWGLEYDRAASTVTITCNQRAFASEAIPFEKLTELAVKEGLIPDPKENEVLA